MAVIERLVSVTQGELASLRSLVIELSSSAPVVECSYLRHLLADPHVNILVARIQSREIVGCLVLRFVPLLTGIRAHIDDVVVAAEQRGSGLGSQFICAAVEICLQREDIRSIDLTSSPHRVVARNLYTSSGFVPRDSQLFRFPLRPIALRDQPEEAHL
jgi:ribosomal protein S18 acetylase RimI-like enzyme